MSVDDCLFCKMVAGQIPVAKIYEDEDVLSFLDIGPISDGLLNRQKNHPL